MSLSSPGKHLFSTKRAGLACSVILGILAMSSPAPAETPEQRDVRMAWWREAKFGMFIHWGLYAVPAGEWKGQPVAGIGEWIMNKARIPAADYAALAKDFNPTNFDAEAWAILAKEAGMKYLIITAKHHDGFAIFNTKASTFDIVDATPFKRDPLKELAAACAKHGIKLGFYYSQSQDWHHPGGAGNSWDPSVVGDYDAYLEKVAIPQVRELLTNYGPVSVLWYDTPRRMTIERAEKFLPVHKLQPGLIVNNRLATPSPDGKSLMGDTETPEQFIPPNGFPGHDWETCMTMNQTWGFKKNDQDWKSTTTLIRNLSDIASKGGNFLLNVGPDATGAIPSPSIDRLREIGAWLKPNSVAIHGTQGGPFPRRLDWGRTTTRKRTDGGTTLYAHIWERPSDGRILLPGVPETPSGAKMLIGGASVQTTTSPEGIWLNVPKFSTDTPVTIAVVEFPAAVTTTQRITGPGPDGSILLGAREAALAGPDDAKPVLSGEGQDASFKAAIGWSAQYSFETPREQLWLATAEVSLAAYNRLNLSAPGPFGRSIASAMQPFGKGPGEFGFVEIGVIRLPAGLNSLNLKSEMEDTRPIEIRKIRLSPLPNDVAAPQAPPRKVVKQRPNPAEPVKYEGCKSYDYPGRHAAILKLKQEINPQVIFIGDSITHHWGGQPASRLRDGEKVLKSDLADYRSLNLGFGHDRTQHAIWRLQNGEIDGTNPDWVVINIGTNNLNDGHTAEEIMSGIRAVCAEVQKRTPKARVILMSVFPRERQPTHGRRKVVADLSKLIDTYSKEQKFINIDLAPQFVPADGVIPPALMPDALHLSAEGYKIWAKALLEVFHKKPGS